MVNSIDEIQTARLAELLGTTPEKLCPGLKNEPILKFLDEGHPKHGGLIESYVNYSNNIVFNDEGLSHLKSQTHISTEDVESLWSQFAHGIQYGYENGAIWDVPSTIEFLVGISFEINLFAADAPEPDNCVLLGHLSFVHLAITKTAEKLAKEADAAAIALLALNDFVYPLEFFALDSGLEEIRHAQQRNNLELSNQIKNEEAEVYPHGKPERLTLGGQETKQFYQDDPAEKEAAAFVAIHRNGAIARYQETMEKLSIKNALDLKKLRNHKIEPSKEEPKRG